MSSPEAKRKYARLRPNASATRHKRIWRRVREWIASSGFFLAAASSVVITALIVVVLFGESWPFFRAFGLVDFLTDTEWALDADPPRRGILPLVSATLVTTGIALIVALPLGTVIAIYLSEFAPFAMREAIKPSLELLSAVPTVVYGYFALLFLSPLLKVVFKWPVLSWLVTDLPQQNMLSAGIVMGIMIIPYVSSLSEDAMRSVPMLLREGSYALGGNKFVTALHVVFPSALSGIGAAYILGISRAIGETMIVAVAAGRLPHLTFNPARSGETITTYIVEKTQGETPYGTPEYQSIFAAGLVLFIITLVFNIAGYALRKRYHQAY
jgi:phosphate transport system permease protein